jgi:tRNA modification GTPase
MATIYALATPQGRGAVAIVRVSGPAALQGLERLTGKSLPQPRMTALRILRDPKTSAQLDQALIVSFKGPASYTGEDVVEYHLHGGPAVIEGVLAALAQLEGYRLAEPGEFTRRAFEHGQLDLTEAEAVADLIDAGTSAQREQALAQLQGGLSNLYEGWKTRLTHLLAYLEADLDFSDQDLPDDLLMRMKPDLSDLVADMRSHLDDNRRGERLREGLHVAVLGAPNAGKSTLVNYLARRDVAIVSPLPGTTRDIVEAHLDLGGFPVILSDTAGLRPDQLGNQGHDAIEAEGIKRAIARANEADLRILLFDGSEWPQIDAHTLALNDGNALLVFSKAELGKDLPAQIESAPVLQVSVVTGAGMPELLNAIGQKLSVMLTPRETPSLTRARHRAALEASVAALARSQHADLPELVAEDIRLAIRHLAHITGKVDVEDLLDVIFRDFCIGK